MDCLISSDSNYNMLSQWTVISSDSNYNVLLQWMVLSVQIQTITCYHDGLSYQFRFKLYNMLSQWTVLSVQIQTI